MAFKSTGVVVGGAAHRAVSRKAAWSAALPSDMVSWGARGAALAAWGARSDIIGKVGNISESTPFGAALAAWHAWGGHMQRRLALAAGAWGPGTAVQRALPARHPRPAAVVTGPPLGGDSDKAWHGLPVPLLPPRRLNPKPPSCPLLHPPCQCLPSLLALGLSLASPQRSL